ncbi:hypothetical protein [Brevibacterium linens]|uniref:Uncharacterized protein n=1 Tax=Brevibacterium linens TaxID=1703 RepID=A0A0B9AT78_BRELN|nr:hypothetical protein [Brevibacterium linens]KHS52568.1 hypothetical protein AE0388_1551 [Brevibacterium linens]
MNWDEKAEEATAGRGYEFSGEAWAFVEGAQWMRRQLRTDEAVERVARAIARLDPDEEWPNETIIDDEYRDECHETARDAINALLGEES